MAKVIRGKDIGEIIEIKSYLNNMITSTQGKDYLVTDIKFTEEEFHKIVGSHRIADKFKPNFTFCVFKRKK